MSEENNEVIKKRIVLIGDDGTGKTSVLKAYLEEAKSNGAEASKPAEAAPKEEKPAAKANDESANEEEEEEESPSSKLLSTESQETNGSEKNEESDEEEKEKPKEAVEEKKADAEPETKAEESADAKPDEKQNGAVSNEENEKIIAEIDSKLTFTSLKLDNKNYELAIWDTDSENDYKEHRAKIYSKADMVFLFYSVDSPSSFDNVSKKWKAEVNKFNKRLPIYLVGNKTDLKTDEAVLEALTKLKKKPVSVEEGNKLAKKVGAKGFYECSATKGEGVKILFEAAAEFTPAKKASAKKASGEKKAGKCTIS